MAKLPELDEDEIDALKSSTSAYHYSNRRASPLFCAAIAVHIHNDYPEENASKDYRVNKKDFSKQLYTELNSGIRVKPEDVKDKFNEAYQYLEKLFPPNKEVVKNIFDEIADVLYNYGVSDWNSSHTIATGIFRWMLYFSAPKLKAKRLAHIVKVSQPTPNNIYKIIRPVLNCIELNHKKAFIDAINDTNWEVDYNVEVPEEDPVYYQYRKYSKRYAAKIIRKQKRKVETIENIINDENKHIQKKNKHISL